MSRLVALALGAGAAWLLSTGVAGRCGEGELQIYFRALDDDVRLGRFDENASLREKRDLLIGELHDTLPLIPTWSTFGQGSYAIGTGVRPDNRDYDIDVGIVFDGINMNKSDPVALKETVRSALSRGNRRVEIRRPCVTIYYLRDGAVDYHVDLAIYARRPSDGVLCLAMGRQHSTKELRGWSAQDPLGLVDTVKARFSGEDASQFRRCARYLKTWRNAQFTQGGAPTSIALTSAALHWFEPVYFDLWENQPDDARALSKLAQTIHERLTSSPRIELPVKPCCNLLDRMTAKQLNAFLFKLQELHSTLQAAIAMPTKELPKAHRLIDRAFGRSN